MQLVSIETLLVLGMLTLPAMSASLPVSQVSDVTSTRRLLHRRTDFFSKGNGEGSSGLLLSKANKAAMMAQEFPARSSFSTNARSMRTTQVDEDTQNAIGEDYAALSGAEQQISLKSLGSSPKSRLVPELNKVSPSLDNQAQPFADGGVSPSSRIEDPRAAPSFRLEPDIEEQLDAGVLRRPKEAEYYSGLKNLFAAVKDPELSLARRRKLMSLCDEALVAIQKWPSGPMEYDLSFANFMFYAALSDIDMEQINILYDIKQRTLILDSSSILPQKVVKAIANKLVANMSYGYEEQKAAFYDFLHWRVFGHPIEPTDEFKNLLRALESRDLSRNAVPVMDYIYRIGYDYQTGKHRHAIENVPDKTQILSKL